VKRTHIYFLSCLILLGLFAWFCQQGMGLKLDLTLGATILAIGLLASGLVMEYMAVLIFLAVSVVFSLAPASVIFSGFTSPAFWLTFSGIPLGLAIKKTGLADRIAHNLARFCKGGYLLLISGIAIFGLIMAFIMPSSLGRVMLITPILIAFAKTNGFTAGSKGYNGILLSGIVASNIAGFAILPSNLPNIILMGSASSLYHIELTYTSYMLIHFPVLGMLKIAMLIAVINWMFKDSPSLNQEEHGPLSRLSLMELRLCFYLALLLIAWLSDSITHLSPAWPGLLAAIVCLLPSIGILDHKNFMKEINVEPLFYVGGLVGLSTVITYTNLSTMLGHGLVSLLPFAPGHNFINYYLLSFTACLVGLITTLPGIPTIMTPLSANLASLTHLPLNTVLMTQVVSYSMFILPYQSPPLLIAMRLGKLPLKEVTKLCLSLFLISIIILMPLDYLWWEVIRLI
jgi:di/tricarboxylate transporter